MEGSPHIFIVHYSIVLNSNQKREEEIVYKNKVYFSILSMC